MVTRRTALNGRAGRKPLRVAGRSARTAVGKAKLVRTREPRHMSAAEVGAKLDQAENNLYRSGRRWATAGHNSLREVFMAGETIRRSFKEAWLAARRAARNIGKEMSAAAEANWPGMRTLKGSVRKAAHRMAA
jgi:hypothetical protein